VAFEWDDDKRILNRAKHGLDFLVVEELFEQRVLEQPACRSAGEDRWMATGMVGDIWVTAIFTWRGENIRIISVRRARGGERRKHQTVYGS
jgi:uncharacterized DUF497 family protein